MSRQIAQGQEAGEQGFPARAGLSDAVCDTLAEAPPVLPKQTVERRRFSRRPRIGAWLLVALPVLVAALVIGGLALTHAALPAPAWLVAKIEARANAALAQGGLRLRILGGVEMVVEEGLVPQARLKSVSIERATGGGLPLAAFPELRARVYAAPLLAGRVELRAVSLTGARLVARRSEDGVFDFGLGGDWALAGVRAEGLDQVMERFEAAFAVPALARLERLEARDLELKLDDRRLGRVWWVRQGTATLRQSEAEIGLDIRFDVNALDGTVASALWSLTTAKTSRVARLSARVRNVPAADLSGQSPALAILSVIQAPISGEIKIATDASGAITPMEAVLELGKGALAPEGAPPLGFDAARLRLSYDPARAEVLVPEFRIDSRSLKLIASAKTRLSALKNGLPEVALSQIAIKDLQLDPEGVFAAPAHFTQGAADLRLRLAPFSVELGQMVLVGAGTRIEGKGRALATEAGWDLRFDAGLGAISRAAFLKLWPNSFVPKSRRWLVGNIAQGDLKNARFALRLAPARAPRLALAYEFADAQARVVKTLPLTQETRGYATIIDTQHRLMIEQGWIPAPDGSGRVDVAGSTLTVPDIRIIPAPAKVRLVSKGAIGPMLSLLDEPPFKLMQKAGLGTDIATGWASAVTELDLILKPKILREELDYRVNATLYDTRSEVIVKGHTLTAPQLTLQADKQGIAISGKGLLDDLPFDGVWAQKTGLENKGRSSVSTKVEISQAAAKRLGIALPAGMLSGSGQGALELSVNKGQPTRYKLTSDLAGIGIEIKGLGWALPRGARGVLSLEGQLGAAPTVDKLRLEGAGLALEGRLSLSKTGMTGAEFSRFEQGDWIKGALSLKGREVRLSGGTLDLRALPKAEAGGAGAGYHIAGVLDRVILSERMALKNTRFDVTTKGGVAGHFSGSVNGLAPIGGKLIASGAGLPQVQVTGADAGAVISAAGIFGRARGGSLELRLTPLDGVYHGKLHVQDTRIKGAGVLAQMLSAASVVGLLEQLNGTGLHFSEVNADFTLSEKAVTVSHGSAEGASMGVTLAGLYLPRTKILDFQGVVSPFYMLNGIGQLISKRGEGVFGFNYALRGAADAPKITVNPLSILTPGALRDLLKREAPTAP